LAELNSFSAHPVKHFTTGEGGLVTTDDPDLAVWMRNFRNHGITSDHRQRAQEGSWFYEMVSLGYNYRLTDFQCALGISQLSKLSGWVRRRREIAALYDRGFETFEGVEPLRVRSEVDHAYHLYVVRVNEERFGTNRATAFAGLRKEGIGVNVHYTPVHLHPYYREQFRTAPGLCPVAEAAYEQILSLPMFPGMSDGDVEDVLRAFERVRRSPV
jgi:perosamine synthetase